MLLPRRVSRFGICKFKNFTQEPIGSEKCYLRVPAERTLSFNLACWRETRRERKSPSCLAIAVVFTCRQRPGCIIYVNKAGFIAVFFVSSGLISPLDTKKVKIRNYYVVPVFTPRSRVLPLLICALAFLSRDSSLCFVR